MRIKRFIAPDIRSALRMVRDEQGAEAVILSNRSTADGVEIVAATDYDEALVQQALRTATSDTASSQSAPAGVAAGSPAHSRPTEQRRAVFQIDERPTAEARFDVAAVAAEEAVTRKREPSRFELMMAALTSSHAVDVPADTSAPADAAPPETTALPPPALPAPSLPACADGTAPLSGRTCDAVEGDAPQAQASRDVEENTVASAPAPHLHAVSTTPPGDPAVLAMQEELTLMRRMIERELGQLTGERLRGSPSRALAMDLLQDYGCTPALAQAVAERIDPALERARVPHMMLAALAQMLPVAGDEPLDRGGIIALVGPTGAGKTTTAAKLAARFATRHRARDVALVTTDHHRTGAREQLQAFGRRLGITVCEAAGAQALADILQQLSDYPLVLVDTAGYAARDRALGSQLAWLRATQGLRSLLVLPANANPLDMSDIVRRYRGLRPEGAVLTKTDETGRLGAALSVLLEHELRIAYTSHGQQVPGDLEPADASRLVLRLEKVRRAADNPLVNEDRHAIA